MQAKLIMGLSAVALTACSPQLSAEKATVARSTTPTSVPVVSAELQTFAKAVAQSCGYGEPVMTIAGLPPALRTVVKYMAQGDQNWNSTDVMVGDHVPTAHFDAAWPVGDSWVVAYRRGGIATFLEADNYRIDGSNAVLIEIGERLQFNEKTGRVAEVHAANDKAYCAWRRLQGEEAIVSSATEPSLSFVWNSNPQASKAGARFIGTALEGDNS